MAWNFFGKKEEPKIELPKQSERMIDGKVPRTAPPLGQDLKRSINAINVGAIVNNAQPKNWGFSNGLSVGNINSIINNFWAIQAATSANLHLKNPIARKYIYANTSGVVGCEGITVRPNVHIGSDEENFETSKILYEEFYKWAEDPRRFSLCGTMDFSKFQQRMEETRAIFGDAFAVVHIIDGAVKLEIIDSMRINTKFNRWLESGNYVSNGIEYELNTGRPIAYYVTQINPIDYSFHIGKWDRITADRMIHLFTANYPNQQRGLPDLMCSAPALDDLDRFMNAAIQSRQVAASAMAFVTNTQKSTYEGIPDEDDEEGEDDSGITRFDDAYLKGGSIIELEEGQDVKTVTPSATFDALSEFVENQMLLVAMGLDMTTQTLKGDTSNASYSASKLVDKIQQQTFKTKQNNLIISVLKPIYINWLRMEILNNSSPVSNFNPSDFNKLTEAQYTPAKPQSLDPLKDLQFEELAMQLNLKSREQVITEMGFDPRVMQEQINKEQNKDKEEPLNGNSTDATDQGSNTDPDR